MVRLLLIVNVAAMLLLAVMAYVGSVVVLDWLEALDRLLDASQKTTNGNPGLKKMSGEPPGPTPPAGPFISDAAQTR